MIPDDCANLLPILSIKYDIQKRRGNRLMESHARIMNRVVKNDILINVCTLTTLSENSMRSITFNPLLEY